MLFAMLRGADEHLDEVVVQAVEDLALEGPLKLCIVEIAGMQLEVVSMYWRIGKAWPDDDFDGVALGASIKLDERVLVEAQLLLDTSETVGSHARIVDEQLA